jgi:photosystem II stability/assembly factor-like uncharacterized protein
MEMTVRAQQVPDAEVPEFLSSDPLMGPNPEPLGNCIRRSTRFWESRMTRWFLIVLFGAAVFGSQSVCAQFNLSEPAESQSERASGPRPDSTKAKQGAFQDEAPKIRKSVGPQRPGNRTNIRQPSAIRETTKADSAATQPPQAEVGRSEDEAELSSGMHSPQASKSLETLIASDPIPEPFFRGPVPRTAAIGEDATLHDVCHVGSHCWAVGDRGVICQSSDSGQTWNTAFLRDECSLRSLCFLTDRIGWVAGIGYDRISGREKAVLFGTRDGGTSWQNLADASSDATDGEILTMHLPGIRHVQYFGLDEAVAVTSPMDRAQGQSIFRSTDGGRSWSLLPSRESTGLWTAAEFISPSEGVVGGQGLSWAAVVSSQTVVINPRQPTLRRIQAVSLDNKGIGWIAGDGCAVFRTDNAGVTWKSPGTGDLESFSKILDVHTIDHRDSVVLMAGAPASCVLRSDNDGEAWRMHQVPFRGRIHRLRCVADGIVLAVGTFGQILRSEDQGVTWTMVRSGDTRAAMMNLITEADTLSWRMLSQLSADQGLRAVAFQLSGRLPDASASIDELTVKDSAESWLTRLGGNDLVSDWMFPRRRLATEMNRSQLIEEWDRETDGHLKEQLPLRLAAAIRNFRPSVVVIENSSDHDPVAEILREAIELSMRIAADDNPSSLFATCGLEAWTVDRVVGETASTQRSALRFDDGDLLPNMGTTIGLLCDTASQVLRSGSDGQTPQSHSDYEILQDRSGRVSVRGVFDGIESNLHGARRRIDVRSNEETRQLLKTVEHAHLEAVSLKGHIQLSKSEGSLIAELQTIGQNLPGSLAVQQLRELGELNLAQGNMEGFLAVQQEITRRFPDSIDSVRAAEILFLMYSSSELRHVRLGPLTQSQTPAGMPSTANSPDAPSAANPLGDSLQPIIQTSGTRTFSASASNQLHALSEKWDQHAEASLRILKSQVSDERQWSPNVRLRLSANLRMRNLTGEYNTLTTELSQGTGVSSAFARADFQVSNPGMQGLSPAINLPQQKERPFLDGLLSDAVWEAAEELYLNDVGASAHQESDSTASLAMLAWDEDFLYVAAQVPRRPAQNSIRPVIQRSHDASHDERDRFEISIDTDRDLHTAFHFVVDESGQTSERCWMLPNWNPKWYVAVHPADTAWQIEAAIPLEALSAPRAKPGACWAVGISRSNPGYSEQRLRNPDTDLHAEGVGFFRFIRGRVGK